MFVFAESFQFIEKGTFKIITRENMNQDVLFEVMPIKYRSILQPNDIGCMYQISETGELFFVLIHQKSLDAFNKGYMSGEVNVKLNTSYIGTYNRMRMFEFISWSN